MGFHAPQEAARILAEAIDFARQGQLAALGRAPASAPVAAAAAPSDTAAAPPSAPSVPAAPH